MATPQGMSLLPDYVWFRQLRIYFMRVENPLWFFVHVTTFLHNELHRDHSKQSSELKALYMIGHRRESSRVSGCTIVAPSMKETVAKIVCW